jgi:hypothetical protein
LFFRRNTLWKWVWSSIIKCNSKDTPIYSVQESDDKTKRKRESKKQEREEKKKKQRTAVGIEIIFLFLRVFSRFVSSFTHTENDQLSNVFFLIDVSLSFFFFFRHILLSLSFSIVLTLISRHNMSLWTTCKFRKAMCVCRLYNEWILWFTHTHVVVYVHTLLVITFFFFSISFFLLLLDSICSS